MSFQINELNEETFQSKLNESVQKISEGEVSLVSLVEDLAPLLTDVSVGKRKLGLSFLTGVISSLPNDALNEAECTVLAQFYRDRMRDHHSLIPDVITGVDSMCRMKHLDESELVFLLRATFNEIHVQSHVLADRSRLFRCHHYLLNNKLHQIVNLKTDYLIGFIQGAEEEKDPNNLVLIFSAWTSILQNFELEPLTEDAFESLACYFPIDFSPPPGIYGNVTKEQLVTALRTCLTNSVFAARSIPLFLEKLDSDLVDAKIDSALSLLATLDTCSPATAAIYLDSIWTGLKREILGVRMQTSDDLVKICLDVIKSSTKRSSSVIQTPENRSMLNKWLELIWADCGRHLKDLELKFMAASLNIFAAVVASGKDFPAIFVLERSVPVLLEMFQTHSGSSESCVSILKSISQLIGQAPKPVTPPGWYEKLIFTCNLAMSEKADTDLTRSACLALSSSVLFLTAEHSGQIFEALLSKALNTGSVPSSEESELFGKLAPICQRPNKSDFERMFAGMERHPEAILPLLSELCKNAENVAKIRPRLVEGLGRPTLDSSEFSWCLSLCEVIWNQHQDLNCIMSGPNILDLILERFLQLDDCSNDVRATLKSLLSAVSRCFRTDQINWTEKVTSKLISADLKKNSDTFAILEILFCNLMPEVLQKMDKNILEKLLDDQKVDSHEILLSVAKIRAKFANKLTDPNSLVEIFMVQLANDPVTVGSAVQIGWLARALLLRNHPLLQKVIQLVLSLLKSSEPGVANQMALSLRDAVKKESDFFDENPILGSLARQKLFAISKPELEAGFLSGINPPQHLKALLCQLQHLPKFLISSEVGKMVSLLASGLNAENDEELVTVTLTSQKDLYGQDNEIFASILPTFLPIWIRLATDRKNSMNIKILALNIIRVSAKTGSPDLVKMKKKVLLQLVPALDDQKRIVRQAAARARNTWSLAV